MSDTNRVNAARAKVAEAQKMLLSASKELAEANGHALVQFRQDYGEQPGSFAEVLEVVSDRKLRVRRITDNATWRARVDSFTDESLKTVNFRSPTGR